MTVEVMRRKSTEEILFIESGVLHMLQGLSSLSCIDKIHGFSYLDSRFVKYTPTLSTTPIRIVFPSSGERRVTLNLVDPKYTASKSSSCGEFGKGPLIYMITDDLVVTPMSSFTAISHLNSSNVSMFDMEERVVRIGLTEVIIHCIRLYCRS